MLQAGCNECLKFFVVILWLMMSIKRLQCQLCSHTLRRFFLFLPFFYLAASSQLNHTCAVFMDIVSVNFTVIKEVGKSQSQLFAAQIHADQHDTITRKSARRYR